MFFYVFTALLVFLRLPEYYYKVLNNFQNNQTHICPSGSCLACNPRRTVTPRTDGRFNTALSPSVYPEKVLEPGLLASVLDGDARRQRLTTVAISDIVHLRIAMPTLCTTPSSRRRARGPLPAATRPPPAARPTASAYWKQLRARRSARARAHALPRRRRLARPRLPARPLAPSPQHWIACRRRPRLRP